MNRFAILLGSAPSGKIQKKLDSMYEFLSSPAGGSWGGAELMQLPCGIDERGLVKMLELLRARGVECLFVYVCTESPVSDWEPAVWLSGNEIPKSLFQKAVSTPGSQLIYDSDRNFVSASGDSVEDKVEVVSKSLKNALTCKPTNV